jgi:hypothetical protein
VLDGGPESKDVVGNLAPNLENRHLCIAPASEWDSRTQPSSDCGWTC